MTEKRIDSAMALAWALYAARVQALLNSQHGSWMKRQSTGGILMRPPTDVELNHIVAALTASEDEGIHRALGPIINLCNDMDDSTEKKDAAFKRQRARVETVYQELCDMKSTKLSQAVPSAHDGPKE